MELAQNIGSASFNINELFSLLKFVITKSKHSSKVDSSAKVQSSVSNVESKTATIFDKTGRAKAHSKEKIKTEEINIGLEFDFAISSVIELVKALNKFLVEFDTRIVKMSKKDAGLLLSEMENHPELLELMHKTVDTFQPDSVEDFNLNLALRGLVNQLTIIFERLTMVATREDFNEESADYREFLYDLVSNSPTYNDKALFAKNVDDLFSKL